MTEFLIIFGCLLPVAIVLQFVRSRWFTSKDRKTAADLLEAFGTALAFSLGSQGAALLPMWPPWLAVAVLIVVVYFPICLLADWMRKRGHHA